MKTSNTTKTLMITSSIALATVLSACGSSSSPKNDDKALFAKCEAKNSFNLDKMKETRKAALLASKDSAEGEMTLRTRIVKDVTPAESKEVRTESIASLASVTKASGEDFAQSEPTLTRANGCKTLDASYSGPGVSETLKGRIVEHTLTSIAIQSVDEKTGQITRVRIAKAALPNRTTAKDSFEKSAKKQRAGLGDVTITVTRTQIVNKQKKQHIVEMVQEAVTANESIVSMHPSAVADAVTLALAKNPTIAQELAVVQAYQTALKEKKQSLSLNFADMIALRDFVAAKNDTAAVAAAPANVK